MIGSFVLGFTDNLVFTFSSDIGLWQFQALRGVACLILIALQTWLMGGSMMPKRWRPVLLRCGLLSMAILLFFGALPLTGVAMAGAGMFTAPIFVLIYSVILFREQIGLYRILAVAIGSLGVILILDLGGNAFSFYALMAIGAGAFYGANHIVTRRHCADESPAALLFVYIIMITIVGIIMASLMSMVSLPADISADAYYLLRGWSPFSWMQLLMLMLNALGTVIALQFMAWGYQRAETSYVAIYEYSYLLFGGLFGWLLWGDILGVKSLFGIVCIVLAGAVITLRNRAAAQSADATA